MKRVLIFLSCLLILVGCTKEEVQEKVKEKTMKIDVNYGVLTGMKKDDLLKIKKNYDLLVIDTSLSKSNIKKLHEHAKSIYMVVSISKLSTDSSLADSYKSMSLKKDENAYVMDVSQRTWQDYIVETVVSDYKDKGIDGIFFKDLDIYEEFQDNSIYNGLLSILIHMHRLEMPVIIDNSYAFVSQAISLNQLDGLVMGVHQHQVFTIYQDNKKTKAQLDNISKQYKNYLNECKENHLNIYISEITTDSDWIAVIKAYCKSHKYTYYISHTTDFSKEPK